MSESEQSEVMWWGRRAKVSPAPFSIGSSVEPRFLLPLGLYIDLDNTTYTSFIDSWLDQFKIVAVLCRCHHGTV